jgi:hypothetical protein
MAQAKTGISGASNDRFIEISPKAKFAEPA